MKRRQPNPKHRTAVDLNARDREHLEVAASFAGWFKTHQFVQRYRLMYPDRTVASIMPSDYCFGRDNKGNRLYPRFLEWDHSSLYRFVGMGDVSSDTPPTTDSALSPLPEARGFLSIQRSEVRFRPAPGISLQLHRATATEAIRAYNANAPVQAQEQGALAALSAGFTRGRVEGQLRILNHMYRTRSVGSDLEVIASRIENAYERWQARLQSSVPLVDGVTARDCVQELLGFFLDAETERTPRSLATKALHFAAPQSFVPVDSYAANLLGKELAAGSWRDTTGLESGPMSVWYHDYLSVVHDIGANNHELVLELLRVDAESYRDPSHAAVRGWPKILDKILWWTGRPRSKSEPLFVP